MNKLNRYLNQNNLCLEKHINSVNYRRLEMMKTTLIKATSEDNKTLERMFQFFAHDTSELSGKEIGDDGYYHGLNDLEDYTNQPNYKTYLLQVDGNLAGFVVVRLDESINYLRHYFVIRKYRKQKIGLEIAKRIFDMFPGDWRVSTMDYNIPAIKFWEKTLNEFTNDSYTKMRRDDNKGPQYEFYRKQLDSKIEFLDNRAYGYEIRLGYESEKYIHQS